MLVWVIWNLQVRINLLLFIIILFYLFYFVLFILLLFSNNILLVNWMGEIWNAGDSPTIETYNAILNGYATQNDVEGVEEYYTLLKKEGVTVNYNTFFGIINGFAKCGNDAEMEKWKLERDRELRGKTLDDGESSNDKPTQQKNEKEEEEEREKNDEMEKTLDEIAKMSLKQKAENLWEKIVEKGLPQEIETLNKLIGKVAHLGAYYVVKDLMRIMKMKGMKLNEISYNAWLLVNEQHGNMEVMEETVEKMKREGVKLSIGTFTILLGGYAKVANMEKVEKWIEIMRENNLRPNVIAYNAITFGLSRRGDKNEAEKWLEKMKKDGVKPNLDTFKNLIYIASHMKDIKGIEYWMEQIKKEGMVPDEMVFKYIFDIITKEEEIQAWYSEMEKMGVRKTVITFNTIIKSLITEGNMMGAQQWYANMREAKIKPDRYTMNCLVGGLAEREEYYKKKGGMLKYWYGILKGEGVQPNARTFYGLFYGISKRGEIEEVTYWLTMAKESGVPVTPELARYFY